MVRALRLDRAYPDRLPLDADYNPGPSLRARAPLTHRLSSIPEGSRARSDRTSLQDRGIRADLSVDEGPLE